MATLSAIKAQHGPKPLIDILKGIEAVIADSVAILETKGYHAIAQVIFHHCQRMWSSYSSSLFILDQASLSQSRKESHREFLLSSIAVTLAVIS